jgi:type IV secretory pathway TrbL component
MDNVFGQVVKVILIIGVIVYLLCNYIITNRVIKT